MMQRDALHAFSPPGPRESVATLGRILFWQTMAGLTFAAVALIASGTVAGTSALIGAAVCLIPNLLFMLRVIPGMLQNSPQQAMNGFYTAEVFKWAATALLFGLAFLYVSPMRPEMLFIGFLVTQFSIILAALVAQ